LRFRLVCNATTRERYHPQAAPACQKVPAGRDLCETVAGASG
jgi:hypothetical protein